MSTKSKLFIIFLGLLIIGVLMIIFVDTKGPEPSFVCATGQQTSGFSDSSQDNCPVSIESYNKWRDWYGMPNYGKIAGLGIAAVGLIGSISTGIAMLVSRSRHQ